MQPQEPSVGEYVEAFPFPVEMSLDDPWRAAADEAADAYRAWCEAPLARRRLAHAAYRAAEEREAAAADHLAHG